ncbi:MAG: extracellular solute-binding protein [Burkholderiaceae bacterium]|nr:extracellular solute-binding protein [Burkholderiaceae bacterium]
MVYAVKSFCKHLRAAALLAGALVAPATSVLAAHGLGMGYEPKYPTNFQHFDYVNPNAPKGGTLVLQGHGSSFDKLNPFTVKGTVADGMGYNYGNVFSEYSLIFDSLVTPSEDEPFSAYGLLAEDIQLATDKLSVTFRLNPKAKFADGTPVLAQDVKHSFDTMRSKLATPTFRAYWVDIKEAVVVNDREIRFDFLRQNSELHMVVGQFPVFSRAWGAGKALDKWVTEAPISSGPYTVSKVDFGKSITYKRRPDYWAKDLPVRKGMFNFDEVRYEYFRDPTAAIETFKAGGLDAFDESSIKDWMRKYTGKKFDSGELVKSEIPHRRGAPLTGYVFNLRQERFQDKRVRQALALAYDFDWLNQRINYGRRGQTQSAFQNNDDLMAKNSIDADEQAFIDGLKSKATYVEKTQGELPKPIKTGAQPEGIRKNLLLATKLLNDAGWVFKDGALRNAKGEAFVLQMNMADRSAEAVMLPFAHNLGKLGIELKLRVFDASVLQEKKNKFEFDLMADHIAGSTSPGNELYDDLHSKSANVKGTRNLSGIQDAVIDEMIDNIVKASDRKVLAAGARALDRYILHQQYSIPLSYSKEWYIAHKNYLQRPKVFPQRMLPDSWLLTMWWSKPKP